LSVPDAAVDMRIIALIENCRIVKKILDYLGVNKAQKKRPLPSMEGATNYFDIHIRDQCIDI